MSLLGYMPDMCSVCGAVRCPCVLIAMSLSWFCRSLFHLVFSCCSFVDRPLNVMNVCSCACFSACVCSPLLCSSHARFVGSHTCKSTLLAPVVVRSRVSSLRLARSKLLFLCVLPLLVFPCDLAFDLPDSLIVDYCFPLRLLSHALLDSFCGLLCPVVPASLLPSQSVYLSVAVKPHPFWPHPFGHPLGVLGVFDASGLLLSARLTYSSLPSLPRLVLPWNFAIPPVSAARSSCMFLLLSSDPKLLDSVAPPRQPRRLAPAPACAPASASASAPDAAPASAAFVVPAPVVSSASAPVVAVVGAIVVASASALAPAPAYVAASAVVAHATSAYVALVLASAPASVVVVAPAPAPRRDPLQFVRSPALPWPRQVSTMGTAPPHSYYPIESGEVACSIHASSIKNVLQCRLPSPCVHSPAAYPDVAFFHSSSSAITALSFQLTELNRKVPSIHASSINDGLQCGFLSCAHAPLDAADVDVPTLPDSPAAPTLQTLLGAFGDDANLCIPLITKGVQRVPIPCEGHSQAACAVGPCPPDTSAAEVRFASPTQEIGDDVGMRTPSTSYCVSPAISRGHPPGPTTITVLVDHPRYSPPVLPPITFRSLATPADPLSLRAAPQFQDRSDQNFSLEPLRQ